MKSVWMIVLGLAALAAGLFYGWARLRSELPAEPTPGFEAGLSDLGDLETKHLVSEETLRNKQALIERKAQTFHLPATDGQSYDLAELLGRGPVVLTFIKLGCPCSEAAQPYFNRVRAAYPRTTFLGVIDADEPVAQSWAARHHARYPLVLDPDLTVVRGFEAENSAYVVVIDRQGRIAAYWPGYSAGMLLELGETLARLSQVEQVELDVSDAPAELYTGCPYML